VTSRKMYMANQFGTKVKQLREEIKLPQRVVAGRLQIDSPMLSKIERGERKAKKEQIGLFARILKADRDQLYTLWLADQLLEVVEGEALGLRALQLAEEEVEYVLKRAKQSG